MGGTMKNDTASQPLNHDAIDAQNLVERYHLATLPADVEERFETHFMDCPKCQEELEAQRSFTRGIKSVAAEEAARTAVGLGLAAWLSRRGFGLLAVLLTLTVGLILAHLRNENQRLETHLAELLAPNRSPGELSSPLVQVPVALLRTLRSDNAPTNQVIDPGNPYAVAVDVGIDPRLSDFSITLLDDVGEIRFASEHLTANALEVIQLTLPTGFLEAGRYELLAAGSLPGGEAVEIGRYPFTLSTGD